MRKSPIVPPNDYWEFTVAIKKQNHNHSKTFVKNYIAKGKQVAGLSIAKVTCKLEDLQKFAYFFDGIEYVTFEVAKMKQPLFFVVLPNLPKL